jgi:hypothetical protein
VRLKTTAQPDHPVALFFMPFLGDPMEWSRTDPTARMSGESQKANQALVDYARQGRSRSLRKLAEIYAATDPADPTPPTRSASTVTMWSTRYSWVARVEQWDVLEMAAADLQWAERQAQLRAQQWEAGQEMVKLGRDALKETKAKDVDARAARELITAGHKEMAQASGLGQEGGSADKPQFNVNMTLEEFKAQQAAKRAEAESLLAAFAEAEADDPESDQGAESE